MARLHQEPKEEHLTYLRELMINKFSKPIVTTNDCKFLEETIQKTIYQRLSTDTLARLFGIKKSNSCPSIFTLDTCSLFVGYKSWEELTKSYSEQDVLYQKGLLFEVIQNSISLEDLFRKLNASSKSPQLYETVNQIILCKAHQKDEAFFIRVFELQIVFEYEESYKYAIYHTIHLLGSLCEQNDWMTKIAIDYYHNLPYSANYFVEWLVVPEQVYYLSLLENGYQSNKSTSYFYHLIHCTHFAETNQWELFLEHYNKIVAEPKNNMLDMRWLGVQLYHHKKFERDWHCEKLVDKILNHSCTNTKDSGDRVSSIFIISTYLYVIDAYEVIITLFERNATKHSSILGYWAELNYNQLKVYYAFSLIMKDRKEAAIIIFKQIQPDRFDLNFKERINVVYKSLESHLK